MTDFEFGTGHRTPAAVTSAPVHATESRPALKESIDGQPDALNKTQDALNKAQADLADASDPSFDHFVGGLFGSDDGAAGGESDLQPSGSRGDGGGGGHDHDSGVTQAEIYAPAYDDGEDDDLLDG